MKQSSFRSTSGRREIKKPTSTNSTKSKSKQKQEQESSRIPVEDHLSKCCPRGRGYLRFFLDPSSPKPTSNQSNSRKNPPANLKKPISSAPKTPISTPNPQSKRTVIRRGNAAKPSSRVSALKSVGCDRARSASNSNLDLNSTPGGVSGLNVAEIGKDHSSSLIKSSNSESSGSNSKTPPLHSTVSPEEMKSVKVTTPVCYAAGHIFSGTPDKRKCRPRGLLVVGEDIVVDKFDIDLSPSAFPIKASMHWLHSPGNKENEDPEGSCSWNRAQNRRGLERLPEFRGKDDDLRMSVQSLEPGL
ncbi:hypothetical protein LINGRAHAP2_LOCUS17675 [Linum grandiflorum]